MTVFEANISQRLVEFFKDNLESIDTLFQANELLQEISGITSFFNTKKELIDLKNTIQEDISVLNEPNRRAYGDFQTSQDLANQTVQYLYEEGVFPEFLLEPTCGKGRFILAALQGFNSIKKIVGIEIYYPYVWQTKFSILDLFLSRKSTCKPEIEIIHADIFEYDLSKLSKKNKHLNALIIGNPPWVTNSELSTLDSKNLPKKSNLKGHKGIDAITGKGNFDIGEYISMQILRCFAVNTGSFAFLVKNSVVKNILQDQLKAKYEIGNIQKLNIDAKKEFNVSVEACLLHLHFNSPAEYTCQELNFYSRKQITEFGWFRNKFVYSIDDYRKVENIDGKSPFIWRQGMKHDCSKIMELDRYNGHFINGFKEELNPEKDLLYGLLKSSDLKKETINSYRKTTIVTQKKVGQDTSYIKREFPKTYNYLDKNRVFFNKRKSSIYRGKPPFSIFGIGGYSFAKYKVAISGMYKKTTFSLVLPEVEKPLMLDDTCYFIGFDTLEEAKIVQQILNSHIVQAFLKAIIFFDAKRPITKDVLMRIDIAKVYDLLKSDNEYSKNADWDALGDKFQTAKKDLIQMSLF